MGEPVQQCSGEAFGAEGTAYTTCPSCTRHNVRSERLMGYPDITPPFSSSVRIGGDTSRTPEFASKTVTSRLGDFA